MKEEGREVEGRLAGGAAGGGGGGFFCKKTTEVPTKLFCFSSDTTLSLRLDETS